MEALGPPASLRSPGCDRTVVEEEIWVEREVRDAAYDEALPLENRVRARASLASSRLATVLYAHALGQPVDVVKAEYDKALADILECVAFVQAHHVPPLASKFRPFPMSSEAGVRSAWALVCLAVCLDDRQDALRTVVELIEPAGRGTLLDAVMPQFIQGFDWPAAPAAKSRPGDAAWAPPVLQALGGPSAASSLRDVLAQWPKSMRTLGLEMPPRQRRAKRFADFASEVGLAVCAFDVDDSGMQELAYYPRDLVAHYRRHLRHTRDAWRSQVAVAPVRPQAPIPCERTDLSLSRHKGVTRWLEIAVGGDLGALGDVQTVVGKPRKLARLDQAMVAMAQIGYAVHADIKDDLTLQRQLDKLMRAWGVEGAQWPGEPPAGPARCTTLLATARVLAAQRGLTLVDLGDAASTWSAVLVPLARLDEWLALGTALGVRARAEGQAFAA